MYWLILFVLPGSGWAYFADWSLLAREREPTCVDIPQNMTLCHNIGYTKMRLPNLVDHDTLHEVSQQSMSWIPLLNIKCHPDTQLFLCSLFSPVCLERPIYPCRSLCTKVRAGCEGRMSDYGFPWPPMLDCAKFPEDNDMCITAQAVAQAGQQPQSKKEGKGQDTTSTCAGTPCDQHLSAENILDNFCRADFVIKTKIVKIRQRRVVGKKAKIFRARNVTRAEEKAMRKPKIYLQESESCCTQKMKEEKNRRYLIMGLRGKTAGSIHPTFIVPWSKSKELKRARRMFKEMNCENLKETSQKMIVDTFAPASGVGHIESKSRRGRSRRRSRTRRDRKRKPVSIWDGIHSKN